MFGQRRQVLRDLALATGLVGVLCTGVLAKERAARAPAVRIGLVSTMFKDVPDQLVAASMEPFRALMEAQTGLAGDVFPGGDADQLARQLNENKIQLAVFHGIEFAWVRQKFPELRPLVIVINQHRHLRAHVFVRQDNPADDLGKLKGQTLAVPRRSREHCHLFLARACQKLGLEPEKFFGKIVTPGNFEDALDDVVDGVTQAVMVDGVSLECYKRRNPGRFAKLKELQRSEVFPAAVVAYHEGAIDPATLRRFRDGMINANQSAYGRQLLMLWKLTAFENIPADYDKLLTQAAKTYPAPKGDSK